MPIPQKVINFLEKAKINPFDKLRVNPERSRRIKYEPLEHRTVYTAYDKAQTLKVKPNMIGKTLVLKIDPAGKQASYGAGKDMAIALIPGNKNLDKNKFLKVVNDWLKKKKEINSHGRIRIMSRAKRGTLRYSHADFVSEKVMKNKFKGVKLGAIPPFGAIWKLPTFIDKGLLKNPKIIVGAGDYNWSIKINSTDFKKLMPELIIGNFGKKR